MDLTITAGVPAPFVRLDSRTLLLSSGPRAVGFALSSAGRWIEETLMIILDEGRATRAQGERVLGGFRAEDGTVTLYGGSREDLIVVALSADELESLQVAVTETLHRMQSPAPPPAERRGWRR